MEIFEVRTTSIVPDTKTRRVGSALATRPQSSKKGRLATSNMRWANCFTSHRTAVVVHPSAWRARSPIASCVSGCCCSHRSSAETSLGIVRSAYVASGDPRSPSSGWVVRRPSRAATERSCGFYSKW